MTMPYCPNPECPFRKRLGESAEFRAEIPLCSDCGATLVEQDVLGPVRKDRMPFVLKDVHKRILWTLALVGIFRILSHLSLPGIDFNALSRLGVDSSSIPSFRISVLSLGLMPYISAYVLVEILALLVQPLKRWRHQEGAQGRAKLVRTARFATLVIAIFHGYFLVTSMGRMAGGDIFINDGPGFRLLLVLTLVAGTFLLVWIADMISAKGIGHGVSLLIFTAYAAGGLHAVQSLFMVYEGENKLRYFGLPFLVLFGLIALIAFMERSANRTAVVFRDGGRGFVPFKLTSAGIVPASWASQALVLVMTILSYMNINWQWVIEGLFPGARVHTIAHLILVVFFYFLFTAFFHDPRGVARFLADRGAAPETPFSGSGRSLDRGLEGMALIGSVYLIALSLSQDVFWSWLGITQIIGGIALIVIVCVVLDILNELKLRFRADGLVKIAEFQEPWKAGLAQSLLSDRSIPSFVRGYYHRALLYFFGPYIEMSVYVPTEHSEAAYALVREHVGQA